MHLYDVTFEATLQNISLHRKEMRRGLSELGLSREHVDSLQLVFAEIATNAVRHAPHPPDHITLGIRLEGSTVQIEISDDGSPFEQVPSDFLAGGIVTTGTLATSGRGLGLVAASLDDAQLIPGKPNRFIGRKRLGSSHPTMLIVEDEPVLLQAYAAILHPFGKVITAPSLIAATAIATSRSIDLIICDYQLGSDTATSLVSAIEATSRRSLVPVIMISSNNNPDIILSTQRLGIDSFLVKPIAPKVLVEAVQLALVRAARRQISQFRHFAEMLEKLKGDDLHRHHDKFEIAERVTTASQGGGDTLISFEAEDRTRLVLFDVMGHGLPAMAARIAYTAALRTLQDQNGKTDPGKFLDEFSLLLHQDSSLGSIFATVLVIDLRHDGTIDLAGAGHPYPAIASPSSIRQIKLQGSLLGISPKGARETVNLVLSPNERLVCVTDGFDTEELAVGGPFPDWLCHTVLENHEKPLMDASQNIAAMAQQRLGVEPKDDWTLVLIAPRAG